MTQNQTSISPADLYAKPGTARAPAVVDGRRPADFANADALIVSAFHCDPDDAAQWATDLPKGRPVVVYCVHGRRVSQGAAAALRAAGHDVAYLDGGIAGWIEQGLPTRRHMGGGAPVKWVTREHPKIDRIACPWLIRRFIDPRAEFIYVPTKQVLATAKGTGGIPYHLAGGKTQPDGE